MKEIEPPKLADEYHWYTEHTALLYSTLKWCLLGACSGVCVGLGTRAFLAALKWSSQIVTKIAIPHIPYYAFLPLALPAGVWLINRFAPTAKGHGTEAVIAAVHENFGRVDWKVAPVKLLATVITIAFGGSVGKEGPCAQIGAAVTSLFADILKLNNEDRRRLVICGIGAGFAAVFGTPVSGALFGIEVLYLGRIEYPVLLPCLIAGISAHLVCGSAAPSPLVDVSFGRLSQPELGVLAVVFGGVCGIAALVLIEAMRGLERLLKRFSKHPYLVAACGGALLAVLYGLIGTSASGLGVDAIDWALRGVGPALALAWVWKIATTSLTLETGGSGGIVTPLFYIGSTLGVSFAHAFHLPAGLFAAFGFIAVASAATNTPIALSVMAMSILPADVGVYAALCGCTAYLLVGHRSVYASQKLGFVKSAALVMELDGPVGSVSRRKIRVRPGTVAARIAALQSQIETLPRRRKRTP